MNRLALSVLALVATSASAAKDSREWGPKARLAPDQVASVALDAAVRRLSAPAARYLGFDSVAHARTAELAGAPIPRLSLASVDGLPSKGDGRTVAPWVLAHWDALFGDADALAYPVRAAGAPGVWFLELVRADGGWRRGSFGSATSATAVTPLRDRIVAEHGLEPSDVVLVDVLALGVSVLAWRSGDEVGFVSLEPGDAWGKQVDAAGFGDLLLDARVAAAAATGEPG